MEAVVVTGIASYTYNAISVHLQDKDTITVQIEQYSYTWSDVKVFYWDRTSCASTE